MKKQERIIVDISTKSILKVLIIVLGLLFVYITKEIFAIVFAALVFAAAISPMVDKMQRRGVPRALGILVIYLVVVGVLTTLIALLIPPVTEQLRQLGSNFPSYYERVMDGFESLKATSGDDRVTETIQNSLATVTENLTKFGGNVFGILSGIFGGFFTVLGVLVLTFYLALEEGGGKKVIQGLAPAKYQPYLVQKIRQIQEKMGLWLRGQLILVLLIGVLSYIGLLILGVNYALVLGMIAGVSEFVPYIGPIIGAIPAIFLAATQSTTKAILVLILYVVIQQLENQIIVPKVMQKTVGLNPIVVLVVTLMGASLAGVVGVILAVPTATILSIFVNDFFEKKHVEEEL